jgi:hypothetical protein
MDSSGFWFVDCREYGNGPSGSRTFFTSWAVFCAQEEPVPLRPRLLTQSLTPLEPPEPRNCLFPRCDAIRFQLPRSPTATLHPKHQDARPPRTPRLFHAVVGSRTSSASRLRRSSGPASTAHGHWLLRSNAAGRVLPAPQTFPSR